MGTGARPKLGAFHGCQYELYSRFEFWRTLAEWGWVMVFMLLPAVLKLIPPPKEAATVPEEKLTPTGTQ